jgi:hypothetical protein
VRVVQQCCCDIVCGSNGYKQIDFFYLDFVVFGITRNLAKTGTSFVQPFAAPGNFPSIFGKHFYLVLQ